MADGQVGDDAGDERLATPRRPEHEDAVADRHVLGPHPVPVDDRVEDGQLDRPQCVRPIDSLAIHDIPQVNVGEACRDAGRSLSLDLNGEA